MRFRADWTPPVSPSLDVAPDGYVFVLNPANGARVRTPLHAGDANVILDAEGRIAGFVTSPHVVQVLDVGRDEAGALYMVLELVRGVGLHELLRVVVQEDERLPVPVVVAILTQAADGLAAAHEATTPHGEPLGIVHRDVSPQNILVGSDGRSKLADFGVAHALHRRGESTATGELRGKLGYFAPEQIQGRPADARSDVFALSVVGWEALSGRRLFRGADALQTLREIRTLEPPPLHALRADVSPQLAAVIARGLAKSPERRIASARLLADELREAAREASAAEVGTFVRRWMGPRIDALEARIREALDASETRPRTAPAAPSMGADPVHDVPTAELSVFEVDGHTTTALHTPAHAETDAAGPTVRAGARMRPLLVAGSVLLALLVIAATIGAWAGQRAVDAGETPAAAGVRQAPEPSAELSPLGVHAPPAASSARRSDVHSGEPARPDPAPPRPRGTPPAAPVAGSAQAGAIEPPRVTPEPAPMTVGSSEPAAASEEEPVERAAPEARRARTAPSAVPATGRRADRPRSGGLLGPEEFRRSVLAPE